MSDMSQGEGWWQASDHKWYPPEQHPDYRAPAAPEPLPPEVRGQPPLAPPAGSSAKWIIVVVLAAAVVALGAFLLFGRDDGKKNTAAVSSSSGSTSASTSSSSSTVALTEAELRARLITAKNLGSNFTEDTFRRNTDPKTLCGTPNPDQVVPPKIDVGSAAKTTTGFAFQEEIAVFTDESNARRAFDLDVGSFSCTSAASTDSSGSTQTFAFLRPQDRSADLSVDQAVEIDFQANRFHGQLFVVRTKATVVQFAFVALDTSDPSTVSEASSVVLHALDRLAS